MTELSSGVLDAISIQKALSARAPRAVTDPGFTPAAVLVTLSDRREGLHVLLQKRSEDVEYHKGEISFPGGMRDPGDPDIVHTALREAYEEMGIRPEDVQVLGRLDDVTTRTRFVVTPFVGTIPHPYNLVVNRIETAEVLEVPLNTLLDPRNLREESRLVNGQVQRGYAYAFKHHLIYGATARMIGQFLDVVRPLWRPSEA